MPDFSQQSRRITATIQERIQAAARQGLVAVVDELVDRTKKVLAVQAPIRVLPDGSVRATRQAELPPMAPRRVSGKLQERVQAKVEGDHARLIDDAQSKRGFLYGPHHERLAARDKRRPFARKAAEDNKRDLRDILGTMVVKQG